MGERGKKKSLFLLPKVIKRKKKGTWDTRYHGGEEKKKECY